MSESSRNARLELLTGGAGGRAEAAEAALERRVTRRGVMSRDRILDAALALLMEGGYPALSISAVCKRAEVSAASLYHHFGDKAGLLAALIEDSMAESARRFVDLVSDHERPLDQLNAYVAATREIGREREGNVISVLSALAQARSESPETAKAVEDARMRAWRFSAAEFSDRFGVEDGMFFTHITFAFASYIDHVAQSSQTKENAKALYKTYERVLFLTAAAIRPDFLKDPDFAAAVARFSRDGAPSSPPPDKEKTHD